MDAEQVALLQSGTDAWNAWRQGRDIEPDLKGADLRGVVLQHADLDDADLTQADLRGADLSGANLANARMSRARMTGIVLANADLLEADLHGADLTRADLRAANLSLAHLPEANLTRANLRGSRLRSTNLCWACLRQADMENADLRRAAMVGADLRAARLDGAELVDAGMMEANLAGVRLAEANLERADLRGAVLTGADLNGTNLRHADLRGARLDLARLVRPDLRGALLVGATAGNVLVSDCTYDATTMQDDVVVTDAEPPIVTVDGLENAQLVHQLLRPQHQAVLERVTIRAGLVVGHYGHGRQAALAATRRGIRDCGLLALSVDCSQAPPERAAATALQLARLVRWVAVDLTDGDELRALLPQISGIPVLPLAGAGHPAVAPSGDILETLSYVDPAELPDRLVAALGRDPARVH